MPYLMLFGLFGTLMISLPALASEDMDSVMFGAETPVETVEPVTETAAPSLSMVNIQNGPPVEEYSEEMDFMDDEAEDNVFEEGVPPTPVNISSVSEPPTVEEKVAEEDFDYSDFEVEENAEG